ncbi:hypothetical protein [Clostridium estertheticum]|uniref:hypothetical protein n=1 Tax=Clostridium estertheticum TaxID=238834 RepID=UPI001C0E44F4|nr:hypothetical protein [Clostridium estertheticum]MBU3186569.1 hypothetical protein [Clostridium estertheticum]
MQMTSVRTIKTFLYEYKDTEEKEKHLKVMLQAKFQVEKSNELSIEFSQIIKESE